MSRTGNFFFASRNQPNYAWWRPLGEILAVAVLAVLFTGVLDLSLEAAGVDTSSGAADKYFGYGSVIVEILAVLVAVWLIGRRPVSSVFTGQPGTKPWVPFAAFAVALVVISVIMSLVGVYGYGASWGQVVGNMGTDFPVELVALLFAALAEEMTFRGVFLQVFTAWTGNPVIGALLAQGLGAYDAACLAVWLHARAGEQQGQLGRGLAASDLIPAIRQLLEEHAPCTK